MRLAPGARLGPFEVVSPLGAGGMGEVYRARDTRLGRDIALKVLPEELAQSPDRLARFEREARAVAGLAHPNIVSLFSIEEHGGTKFLVLELVEGRDLTSVIGPSGLPLGQVVDIAIPLSEALVAAHEKGVVHRDLKPANVMLSREGRVKVLDFGLAKALAAEPQATMAATISEVGQVLGTAAYMAPEQIRGENVDGRSDLFAFGILVYELATGRRPFRGTSAADVTSAILRDTPEPLTRVRGDLPADLERIVERCLEKNPRDRYQTALDVLNELKRIGRTAPAPRTEERTVSIAVLPFANRSASADDEYFAEGLADELLSVLGRIRGLRVSTRTASARFKGTTEDIQSIGRALQVETILEGSVRKAGNRVRIAVQLAKVKDGYRLWSESYDRTLDDVFAVQDDIAQSVVKELRTALLGEAPDSDASRDARAEVAKAVRGRTANPEVHRLLLQARHLVAQRLPETLERARALLARALELDPTHAPTYMSHAYLHLAALELKQDRVEREAELAKVKAAADRALELAPEHPEVLAFRATSEERIEMNWRKGYETARRALELAPTNIEVLRTASRTAIDGGLFEEAEELLTRLGNLDPLNFRIYVNFGLSAFYQGRHAQAVEHFQKAIDLGARPVVQSALGESLAHLGRWDEALEAVEREPIEGLATYTRALIFKLMNRREEATRELERLIRDHAVDAPSQIAEVCAELGRTDEAFEWIERAIDSGDSGIIDTIVVSPHFRPIQADPRMVAFRKRLHFDSGGG